MASIGHQLEDLTPAETQAPRAGRTEALTWAVLGLIALLAFVGWLLVG